MNWFQRLLPKVSTPEKKGVPEGVWSKCELCQAVLYRAELERHLSVCPRCDHHFRISGRQRLKNFCDPESAIELGTELLAQDVLKFKDNKKYKERLSAACKHTEETEALVVMQGQLNTVSVVVCAFNFDFIGGSMSSCVGERFRCGAEAALRAHQPFIVFSTSGGARMQEGLFSLFQMAKTTALLARLHAQGIPFISILTDPTMGGVSASFAMLGDVVIAEPKALIGFSGPRVIEQTIRQTLPEGFQRSEFLLAHGAIDMIVDRRQMRSVVSSLLLHLLHQPRATSS